MIDEGNMRHVIGLARLGLGQVAPNPMVGASIWKDDAIVGEGYHAQFGGPHAEVAALGRAGDAARGGTLYVNLEPCNHTGKTPPCTDAIIAAGIKRVVISMRDPNPVAGGGVEKLRAAGIEVDIGTGEDEARELNAAFVNSFSSDLPWVTLKLAMSLDGSIAPAEGPRAILTGNLAHQFVHRMRAANDAIAVGAATAAADDPELTARITPAPRIAPTRIVFDRSGRLSSQSKLVRTARQTPTLVITGETTNLGPDLRQAGVQALQAHDLGDALRKLKVRGINALLVEGGAGLAASFLGGGFVDRLVIFHAPLILGSGSLNAFSGISPQSTDEAPRFRIISTQKLDDDVMTVYAVEKK